MSRSNADIARQVVEVCGGCREAVGTVMQLERVLWELVYADTDSAIRQRHGSLRLVDTSRLLTAMQVAQRESALQLLLEQFRLLRLLRDREDGMAEVHLDLLRPGATIRVAFEGIRSQADLIYFMRQSTREHFGCALTPDTVRLLHTLAAVVNDLLTGTEPPVSLDQHQPLSKHLFDFQEEFLPSLRRAVVDWCPPHDSSLKGGDASEDIVDNMLGLFIECCRLVEYILPAYKCGFVDVRSQFLDAEFLTSGLFGLPTSIEGFDELFGGGGVLLAHNLADERGLRSLGRAILVRGPYGTGKSLLTLQLAMEVARKGGIAWIVSMEQRGRESLHTLEAMRLLPSDNSVVIATDPINAEARLAERSPGQGVLIILPCEVHDFTTFMRLFEQRIEQMEAYGRNSLRLLCVDPINSVLRDPESSQAVQRTRTVEVLGKAKDTGTNVILVAEKDVDAPSELRFAENVADTVVKVSTSRENEYSYSQRYLEISKSRLQREQRGVHPFSIVPAIGFRISPSAAAVSARIRTRGLHPPDHEVAFGVPSIDVLLGPKAVNAGDVIVLQGSGGTFKSPLGSMFLLGSDRIDGQKHARSLYVCARDEEAQVERMLQHKFVLVHLQQRGRKAPEDLILLSLSSGNIQPGRIIQRIQEELAGARASRRPVDRVLLDDIGHWEMICPFIRADRTFGDTLLDFLRRQRVTTLVTCGEAAGDPEAVLQRSVIDSADSLIQLERVEFRDRHRVLVRVVKTRGMHNRRESFELDFAGVELAAKRASTLLRVSREGVVEPVDVRLYLRKNTAAQERYSHIVEMALQGVLSKSAQVTARSQIHTSAAIRLSELSAVDEIQVIQLAESEATPTMGREGEKTWLHVFESPLWDNREWGDLLPRLRAAVTRRGGSFFAVPYYADVSLLSYRSDVPAEAMQSWEALEDECRTWEGARNTESDIFFAMPRLNGEDLNCLFFEILSSLERIPDRTGSCRMLDWLGRPAAVKACTIFRNLCRRWYGLAHSAQRERSASSAGSNDWQASVSRHWYSGLQEVGGTFGGGQPGAWNLAPLPGNVSIAGDEYLGVPVYSASPEVALEIIKLITTRQCELERTRSGMGLPTHRAFYEAPESRGLASISLSPDCSMPAEVLRKLVEDPFRRSWLGCYGELASVLAHHLERTLRIPDGPENAVCETIKHILESLRARAMFVWPSGRCSTCRTRGRYSRG